MFTASKIQIIKFCDLPDRKNPVFHSLVKDLNPCRSSVMDHGKWNLNLSQGWLDLFTLIKNIY